MRERRPISAPGLRRPETECVISPFVLFVVAPAASACVARPPSAKATRPKWTGGECAREMTRAFCARGCSLPRYARHRKQYDPNPRYKYDNIVSLELDPPERTTQDFEGPNMLSRVQARRVSSRRVVTNDPRRAVTRSPVRWTTPPSFR